VIEILRAAHSVTVVVALGALSSCATGGREADDPGRRLPMALHLTVNVPPEGLYGTPEEWTDEIIGALLESNACADAWADGDAPGPGPDMELVVDLSSREPRPSEREVQGALLDFLAWSTVPPTPLWISDVRVDPGLHFQVEAFEPGGKEPILLGEGEADCPPIKTCHLDRNAFLSWKTLGAIVVPPFVFKEPDREHLIGEIAADVRRAVADAITKRVRYAPWLGEGLRELKVIHGKGGVPILHFDPDLDVIATVSVGIEQLRPRKKSPKPLEIPISLDRKPTDKPLLFPGFDGDGRFLRIEVIRREGKRTRLTFPLPPGRAAAREES
jgi:hypothetical protein